MSNLSGGFSAMMADVKTRMVVILLALIVIGSVIFVLVSKKDTVDLGETVDKSRAQPVPQQLQKAGVIADPGKAQPPDKQRDILLRHAAAEQADVAEKKGTSAVPTLTSDQFAISAVPSIDETKRKEKELTPEEQYAKRLAAQQEALAARRAAEEAAKRATASSKAVAKAQAGFEKLMAKQAKSLYALWKPTPQVVVVGAPLPDNGTEGAEGAEGAQATGQAAGKDTKFKPPPIYKAGDILYALLDTSVNSDEPGPILATIVSGSLKGGKVIGQFSPAGQNAEKLLLQFTVLNVPNLPSSISMSAVAIDTETARTALATEVNHHYLVRYGTLFASSFLEGMSDAVMAPLTNPGFEFDPNSGSIISSSVKSSTRDQVIAGFGKAGAKLGTSINNFDRPPTITINAGTPMGLLMLQDLTIEGVQSGTAGLSVSDFGAGSGVKRSTVDLSALREEIVGGSGTPTSGMLPRR